MHRWDTEIRATLSGRDGSEVIDEVISIFNELSVLSGVPVVTGKGFANFIIVVDEDPLGYFLRSINEEQREIVFGNDSYYINQLRADMKVDAEPDCAGFVVIGGHPKNAKPINNIIDLSSSIGFTLVLVQYSENKGKNLRCLYEEMYQGFGLFNDQSGAICTMFDNELTPSSPTGLDRLLIYLLYSEAVQSGMTKPEALLSLAQFIGETEELSMLMERDASCVE
ncbi:MAG: DUF2927 domain-containing protein [Kiloniellales bacterium]